MKPSFQRRAFWSFAGMCLLGLAGWQSVQTTLAGRKAAGSTLPPPLRTRSCERPLLRRETAAGDPVADYLARAKRGMTEREVRWMLEDFKAAGLDRPEEELADFTAAQAHRKKQEEWYLAALSEGLSLTSGQKDETKTKLAALFARDLQEHKDMESENDAWRALNPGKFYFTGDDGAAWQKLHPEQSLPECESKALMYRFCRFPETLFSDAAFTPWNLTFMTKKQSSLTLRFWLLEDWKQGNTNNDPFADSSKPEPDAWLYAPVGIVDSQDPFSDQRTAPTLRALPRVPALQDPVTGNLTQVPDGIGDAALVFSGDDGRPIEAFLPCGNVLPLTTDQKSLWDKPYDLAAQALLCQPAQLRLALLQRPDLAQPLREELDLAPSERGLKIPSKPAASAPSE